MWNRVSNAQPNNSNRPVCHFYLQGKCKFGDSCRNYHPNAPPANPNRFGALSGGNQNRTEALPYGLSADSIRADLTVGDEKPGWPLSCYGAGRDAPRQLIEGPLEQSMEELRAQYYLAKATSGNTQQYEQAEASLLQQAEDQARQILGNIDGALKFVIDGKDQHPNREDITQKVGNFNWSQTNPINQSSPFGAASSAQAGTFGAPSSGFGAASSGFGRPSPLGGGGSAFGRPSALGGGANPFGAQPAANNNAGSGTNTGFGGGAGMGSSPFAQAANSSAGSAFGQPSALGGGGGMASASTPSPFAQAANNTSNSSSVFGKPSVPNASPFSQNANNTNNNSGSVFGKPSTPNPSPFAQNATNNSGSVFGQPSAPSASPFAAAAAASSQPAANSSGFGQSSTTPASNPFSNGSANKPSPFGSAPTTQSSGFGSSSTANQPAAQQGAVRQGGRLTSFRGRPVEYSRVSPNDPSDTSTAPFYTNAQGRKERVWMPDGPPGPNPDVEDAGEVYQGDVGKILKQIYDAAQGSDIGFKDGFVPEIPPKREWVSFEL